MARMIAKYEESHTWMTAAMQDSTVVAICRSCGLLKLHTPTGLFYFEQKDPPFAPCRQPRRDSDYEAEIRDAAI